ncbi:unnamed protein product, partial [Phaeothamnion confervicola]
SSVEWQEFLSGGASPGGHSGGGGGHLREPGGYGGGGGIELAQQEDPLGCMTEEEVAAFRTKWCANQHPHLAEFCENAHREINKGWLRRNPRGPHFYTARKCPDVTLPDQVQEYENRCRADRDCPMAHSKEELNYHPISYKHRRCNYGRTCRFKALCPFSHVPPPSLEELSASDANAAAAAAGGGRYSLSPASAYGFGLDADEDEALYQSMMQQRHARQHAQTSRSASPCHHSP